MDIEHKNRPTILDGFWSDLPLFYNDRASKIELKDPIGTQTCNIRFS